MGPFTRRAMEIGKPPLSKPIVFSSDIENTTETSMYLLVKQNLLQDCSVPPWYSNALFWAVVNDTVKSNAVRRYPWSSSRIMDRKKGVSGLRLSLKMVTQIYHE
jgi:hypothetical protein